MTSKAVQEKLICQACLRPAEIKGRQSAAIYPIITASEASPYTAERMCSVTVALGYCRSAQKCWPKPIDSEHRVAEAGEEPNTKVGRGQLRIRFSTCGWSCRIGPCDRSLPERMGACFGWLLVEGSQQGFSGITFSYKKWPAEFLRI